MSNINVMRKNLGPVTAYKYAVSKGFTGTEEEFAELMASYASIAQDVSAESRVAEGYALGKQNGVDVGDQSPYYHANAKYHAEQAAAKAQEAAESAAQAESAIEVDDTLSVEGRAADAKVVGDAINSVNKDLSQKYSSITVDVVGEYDGSYTNDAIDSAPRLATVYAECEENCEYVVEKIATNRFAVFFTAYPPLTGLEILSYRVIDHTASKITAKAPQGAKYLCAYVYNTNTDSNIDTKDNVVASVSIKKSSAVDAVARARIKAVSEITDMVVGNDIDVTYVLGGLSLQGAEQKDNNRIRTIGFIDKKDYKTSIIINNPSYQFSVRYYKDGVFSSSDAVWRSSNLSDVFVQDSQCNQIRILVRLSSNAAITSSIIDDAIKAISVKNEGGAFYVPAEVKQAIYNLFSVSAYASTSGVASNLSVLSDWVGD